MIGLLLGGLWLATGVTGAQDGQGQAVRRPGRFEHCRYLSPLDGATIEYALWYPADYDEAGLWPLIIFLHGSGEGGDWEAPTRAEAGIPVRTTRADLPFLVVSPLMRGTWSINGPAERDVLDTLADVQSRANVDPNRIHLTGLSLGAFAAWAIAAHYPDRFASLSVFAGGGQPDLVGNLRHLPTWVFHGAADEQVPVAESVRMVRAAEAARLPVLYTEIPGVGHNCWREAYAGDALYGWMAGQTRVREPRRITYRTHSLRHNRAYWATIDSLIDPARPATIDVFIPQGSEVYVHADNVGRLVLTPPSAVVAPGTTPQYFVDNHPARAEPVENGWALQLADASAAPLRKRHGLSGPIQDGLWDTFVIVTADAEDPVVTEVWHQAAQRAFRWTEGLTYQNFKFMPADQVTPEVIQSSHLICFGNPETHSLLGRVAAQLPLVFTRVGLQVYGRPGAEQIVGLVMIYPNPLNPDRYLVTCSGRPKAVAALAALTLQPPYLAPMPIEDLVVVTLDGTLLLQDPTAGAAPSAGGMAPTIPPRGAVFDGNWQLPAPVIERLIQGPSATAPATGHPR
ncbi:MAG: alpha/beta hydrolase-fold protein [Planctomycetota bacterium]